MKSSQTSESLESDSQQCESLDDFGTVNTLHTVAYERSQISCTSPNQMRKGANLQHWSEPLLHVVGLVLPVGLATARQARARVTKAKCMFERVS